MDSLKLQTEDESWYFPAEEIINYQLREEQQEEMDSLKLQTEDNRWYFSAEEIYQSPSRRDGISFDTELKYKFEAVCLIVDLGQRLSLCQRAIDTAIVYMHRFYAVHSFKQYHRNVIAPAALFLAADNEFQPRKLNKVVTMADWLICTNSVPRMEPGSQAYFKTVCNVVEENILLKALGFEDEITHPHMHVEEFCNSIGVSDELKEASYSIAANSVYLTRMCLRYKPRLVACFCIYLACIWKHQQIIDSSVSPHLLKHMEEEFLKSLQNCPPIIRRILIDADDIQRSLTNSSNKNNVAVEVAQAANTFLVSSSSTAVTDSKDSDTAPANLEINLVEHKELERIEFSNPPPYQSQQDLILKEIQMQEEAEINLISEKNSVLEQTDKVGESKRKREVCEDSDYPSSKHQKTEGNHCSTPHKNNIACDDSLNARILRRHGILFGEDTPFKNNKLVREKENKNKRSRSSSDSDSDVSSIKKLRYSPKTKARLVDLFGEDSDDEDVTDSTSKISDKSKPSPKNKTPPETSELMSSFSLFGDVSDISMESTNSDNSLKSRASKSHKYKTKRSYNSNSSSKTARSRRLPLSEFNFPSPAPYSKFFTHIKANLSCQLPLPVLRFPLPSNPLPCLDPSSKFNPIQPHIPSHEFMRHQIEKYTSQSHLL